MDLIQKAQQIPIAFVVGRGRSGTTLLQSIFDVHPRVCAPAESRFLLYLYSKYAHVKRWNAEHALHFVQDLLSEPKIKLLWHVNHEALLHVLMSNLDKLDYGTVCKLVYLHDACCVEKGNVQLIVDKNPVYSLFIPLLLKIFPEAKFIHLVRDPRANVVSHKGIGLKSGVKGLALSWRFYNRQIEKTRPGSSGHYQLLRYEDLVNMPEKLIRQASEFLDLPYLDEMQHPHKYAPALSGKSKNKVKEKALKGMHRTLIEPIHPARINKWKSTLNEKQVRCVEAIAHSYMFKYRYSFSFKTKVLFSCVCIWEMADLKKRILLLKCYYLMPFWIRKKRAESYGIKKLRKQLSLS